MLKGSEEGRCSDPAMVLFAACIVQIKRKQVHFFRCIS